MHITKDNTTTRMHTPSQTESSYTPTPNYLRSRDHMATWPQQWHTKTKSIKCKKKMKAPKWLLFHIRDNHITVAPKQHPMYLHTLISTISVFTLRTTCPLKFAYEMVILYHTSPLEVLSSLLTHTCSLKSSSETVTLHRKPWPFHSKSIIAWEISGVSFRITKCHQK